MLILETHHGQHCHLDEIVSFHQQVLAACLLQPGMEFHVRAKTCLTLAVQKTDGSDPLSDSQTHASVDVKPCVISAI